MIIAQIKKYQTIMRTEVWKWVTCTVFKALAIDSVYGENYSSKANTEKLFLTQSWWATEALSKGWAV